MGYGLGLNMGLGRGGNIPFDPFVYSPVLWLDASDASTLFTDSAGTTPATADGDAVGKWSDKSGNGNHATQSSGVNKPTLKLSIQNSKNIVRANGTSSYMSLPSVPLQAPYTVYLVFKKTATDNIFELASGGASDVGYLFECWSDNAIYGPIKSAFTGTSGVWKKTLTNFYGSFTLFQSDTDGTTAAVRQNGSVLSLSVAGGSATIPATWTKLFYGDTSSFANGDLAETIWFSSQHGSTTRALFNAYFSAKWGLGF